MATIKQKKAFKNVVENGGNITKAMKDAEYSKNTANTPQKLTESVGWKELMDTYLPDELLAKKHKELLNKTDKEGYLDTNAVKGGLDMAYKLKGSYAPEKKELSGKIETVNDAKLDRMALLLEEQLKDEDGE